MAVTSNKKIYRYFMYSVAQHKLREETEAKMGKVFIPGEVLINGQWKKFTQLSVSPNSVYSDAVIVTKGYLDKIQYKDCSSKWRAEEL